MRRGDVNGALNDRFQIIWAMPGFAALERVFDSSPVACNDVDYIRKTCGKANQFEEFSDFILR